jgi:Sulfotransferase family
MKPTSPQESFPFIVGCGRSGTTLLRAMLNAHSAFAVPSESYFPVWFSRFPNRYRRWDGRSVESFFTELSSHNYFAMWGLSPDKVHAALQSAGPEDFSQAVRTVYALYAQEKGKTRYADKTPIFVSHMRRLADLFPEAVFIHLLRDGRDVALSIMDVTWGPDDLDQAALYWKQQVRRGLKAADALGPGRYYSLRYEDLLAAPAVELERLCHFVGVEYSEQMLSYAADARSLFAELHKPHEHRGIGTAPAPRRDWRQKLSADDREVFRLLAGDVLAAAGYRACDGRPSRAALVRAGRARTVWAGRQLHRRARSSAARLLDAIGSPRAR